MLATHGPPVEAANVMRYDANTDENIYAHFEPPPQAAAPPQWVPRAWQEREVRLAVEKENAPEERAPRK